MQEYVHAIGLDSHGRARIDKPTEYGLNQLWAVGRPDGAAVAFIGFRMGEPDEYTGEVPLATPVFLIG